MGLNITAKQFIKKAEELKSARCNFDEEFQKCGNYFRPLRADQTTEKSKGDKSNFREIYESYPINAVKTLKSIIIGVFFNRSITPINLEPVNKQLKENIFVKQWLDDFVKMMLGVMFNPRSGFERSFSSAIDDEIVLGTMATHIKEGRKHAVKYETLNIKNYLISEDDEGDLNYIVLKYKMTAEQIMAKWGNNDGATIPEKIRESAVKKPLKEYPLQLHIYDRKERDKRKDDQLNKPIGGCWVCETFKVKIEEIGFNSMPVAIGRSEVATGETYGTARASIAYADASQANVMSKNQNEAQELALRPPLAINGNTDKRLNLRAGGLNYPEQKSLRAGVRFAEQIITTGNLGSNEESKDKKMQSIKEIFFLDKLKIFDDPRATATQVLEKRAESFRIMGDFISGIVEYTEQLLDRTFNILLSKIYLKDKNGNFILREQNIFQQEMPKELQGQELKINYINPITQSQRLTESTSIEKLMTNALVLAKAKPDILDNINFDKVIAKYSTNLGVDPDLQLDEDEVMKIREEREEQLKQQQSLEQENIAVDTATKAKQGGIL